MVLAHLTTPVHFYIPAVDCPGSLLLCQVSNTNSQQISFKQVRTFADRVNYSEVVKGTTILNKGFKYSFCTFYNSQTSMFHDKVVTREGTKEFLEPLFKIVRLSL